jgi:hypothetical protein
MSRFRDEVNPMGAQMTANGKENGLELPVHHPSMKEQPRPTLAANERR